MVNKGTIADLNNDVKAIKTVGELREVIHTLKEKLGLDMSVGLVPTMGALHAGHQSLILEASKECDIVVVSDFVNPIQFGPNEDYENYPRQLKKDIQAVQQVTDRAIVFAPEVKEMYFDNESTRIVPKDLTNVLCGSRRPGHFEGVCTVVGKLFNIVRPDKAFFGMKDAQQVAVIKRMVRDLNFPVEIVPCPIIRDKKGLALSSRNSYLTPVEKNAALVLSRSLSESLGDPIENAESLQDSNTDPEATEIDQYNDDENSVLTLDNLGNIKQRICDIINSEPMAKIDYVEVVDFETLAEPNSKTKEVLIALAVFVGEEIKSAKEQQSAENEIDWGSIKKTRLIDNVLVELPD
ncbi:MAG: pantoate--beta-alanine ligase [Candidatus Ancillula sp.]|jgi:pantoate--beta-alanine ligase|nr:pantoate--beta-alanine ligase [Candidatus Ancillula sp.]